MRRGFRWIVAGSLLAAGGLATGCPEETLLEATPHLEKAKIRDYLFPPSASAEYVYEATFTTWSPGESTPHVDSTASLRHKTIRLTENEADFAAFDALPPDTLPYGTVSIVAAPEGTVTLSERSINRGDVYVRSYSDATLTSKGAIIRPASGSTQALIMARLAKETITVPAGTFETIKVLDQGGGDNPIDYYQWMAKGMGLSGVKRTLTSTRSIENKGISTWSMEVVLKSFTP